MQDTLLWFKEGFGHITDPKGYDHILFVGLLTLAFPLNQWKKLLALITAFTFGHSISLALSVTIRFSAPQRAVELCIALSILITAVYQLYTLREKKQASAPLLYSVITFFGLIHGMGFSYQLISLLGRQASVAKPLLLFNIGLEAGQLVIVGLVILFSLLLTAVFKIPYQPYKTTCLCIIGLIALFLCAQR